MEIVNNKESMEMEYKEGNYVARLEYRFYKKSIAFMHTTVPAELAGKGVASALATEAFKYAKDLDRSVMVYCPFVANFIKKHTNYREQLNKEFHRQTS